MLVKAIWQLLEHLALQKEVSRLAIITNGTLLEDNYQKLLALKRKIELLVSLEGADAPTNDAIRGAGTFKTVIKNLQKIKEAEIPCTIMFTVMKSNLHQVPAMVELCRRLGCDSLIIERFFPLGKGKLLAAELLNGDDFLKLWQEILALNRIDLPPAELIPWRAIKVCFKGEESEIFGSECVVAESGLALLPDGTVFPCRRFPLSVGNLFCESLALIWEKEIMQKLRDKKNLQSKCSSCGITNCRGCRAMSYILSKDPFADDPHCWL